MGIQKTIIGVYSISEKEPAHMKDALFQQLNNEVMKIGTSQLILSVGDFNVRT